MDRVGVRWGAREDIIEGQIRSPSGIYRLNVPHFSLKNSSRYEVSPLTGIRRERHTIRLKISRVRERFKDGPFFGDA